MKNSNDTIGNRTCDLPTCNAVPQPTAPPRVPNKMNYSVFKFWIILLEASLLLILIRYYLRLWKCKIFYPQDVSYNK